MNNHRPIKRVRLDAEALVRVGASDALALLPRAFGASVALLAEPPGAMPKTTGSDVATVEIMGPLAQRAEVGLCAYVDGYDAILARFEAALASDAPAVEMLIDSPGGDASGAFETAKAMRALKAQYGKPVVAFVDELAASAGYLLATVADEIIVPPTGEVGSIGVIAVHVSQARALDAAGLDVTVFRSRGHKADGMSLQPLTKDAAERIQASSDALDAVFVQAVTDARPQARKAIDTLDGRTAMGAEAVKLGLADRVGSRVDATARARQLGAEWSRHMDQAGQAAAKLAEAQDTIKSLIDATGAESYAAALGRIEAGRQAAEELPALRTRLAQLEAEADKRAKEEAVDAVLAEGRVRVDAEGATELAGRVTPGNAARLRALGLRLGVDELRAHLAELPVHAAARPPAPPPAPKNDTEGAGSLSDEERAYCADHGIDPDAFAKSKAYHTNAGA